MCAYDKCVLLSASKCSQSKWPGFLPLHAVEWMRKRSGNPGEVYKMAGSTQNKLMGDRDTRINLPLSAFQRDTFIGRNTEFAQYEKIF